MGRLTDARLPGGCASSYSYDEGFADLSLRHCPPKPVRPSRQNLDFKWYLLCSMRFYSPGSVSSAANVAQLPQMGSS